MMPDRINDVKIVRAKELLVERLSQLPHGTRMTRGTMVGFLEERGITRRTANRAVTWLAKHTTFLNWVRRGLYEVSYD